MFQALCENESVGMSKGFSDEIRIHMRIPAEKIYFSSVSQTLQEVLDYLNIDKKCRDFFIQAIEEVAFSYNLFNIVGQTYVNETGFIDWDFFLEDLKLVVVLDNRSVEVFEPSNTAIEKKEPVYIFEKNNGFVDTTGNRVNFNNFNPPKAARVRMILNL